MNMKTTAVTPQNIARSVWAAFSESQVNALWLESVRAYYNGLYRQLVTELPRIAGGQAVAMDSPGLGTALSEELLAHPSTLTERSTL